MRIFERLGKGKSPADLPVDSDNQRADDRAGSGLDVSAVAEPVPALQDWAADDESGYYLFVARLLPYKNVDRAIDAFQGLDERLVVVGFGPLQQALAKPVPNVRLVSEPSDALLQWTYAHCRALLAPSLEDYGLTPLKAAAHGRPTLALGTGGYFDTVVPGVTGTFFAEPTAAAIRAAVVDNRDRSWSAADIVRHADTFAEPAFHAALRAAEADLAGRRPPDDGVTPQRRRAAQYAPLRRSTAIPVRHRILRSPTRLQFST